MPCWNWRCSSWISAASACSCACWAIAFSRARAARAARILRKTVIPTITRTTSAVIATGTQTEMISGFTGFAGRRMYQPPHATATISALSIQSHIERLPSPPRRGAPGLLAAADQLHDRVRHVAGARADDEAEDDHHEDGDHEKPQRDGEERQLSADGARAPVLALRVRSEHLSAPLREG